MSKEDVDVQYYNIIAEVGLHLDYQACRVVYIKVATRNFWTSLTLEIFPREPFPTLGKDGV